MNLSADLVRRFSSMINTNKKEDTNPSTEVYGTAVKDGNNLYVIFDGSTIPTPASTIVEVETGDRVSVTINNHMATITGNYSAPPSGRAGDKYFKFTEEGLIIGKIDEDTKKPSGGYVLISDDGYFICDDYKEDENGTPIIKKIARFADGIIEFYDGKGRISYTNDILVLRGEDATGLRSTYGEVVSEVGVAANPRQIGTSMKIAQNGVDVAGVYVDGNGVNLVGNSVEANSVPLVTAGNIYYEGTCEIKMAIKANNYRQGIATVQVPSGYKLAGVRQVSTNHVHVCKITAFGTNPSNNTVFAYIDNTSNNKITDLNLHIEWFAVYANRVSVAPTTSVDLGDDV